jgi:hypothetical protein
MRLVEEATRREVVPGTDSRLSSEQPRPSYSRLVGLPCRGGFAMKYVMGLGMLLVMTGPSFADANASPFRIENGKIVIAQNACEICDNNRTSCVLACNGGGR